MHFFPVRNSRKTYGLLVSLIVVYVRRHLNRKFLPKAFIVEFRLTDFQVHEVE